MYQMHPTETFRERQLALLREAEDRRLARRLRAGRPERSRRGGRPMAALLRVVALWGRTGTPFFRA